MADNGIETEVVVVGGGGAGLAAALEAARAGRQVLLLEKNPRLGGTTRLSVGSISACCTPQQQHHGIKDSPQEFFEDIGLFNQQRDLNTRDNEQLRRLLTEESGPTLQWLMDLGLVFFGPMPEPPNRYPRMHNVMPNASAYIYIFTRHLRQRGVDIRLGVKAERLLTDAGRVTGVEATMTDGRPLRISASQGVILASGDYSGGTEMKQTYMTSALADIEGINPTSTGDGQRMALEVGAQLVNGDLALGPEIRFVEPPRKLWLSLVPPVKPLVKLMHLVATRLPEALLRPLILSFLTAHLAPSPQLFEQGAILVNQQGRRFVDERQQPALAIPQQPNRMAYIVFDHQVAQRFTGWPYFISTAPGIAYAFLPDYRRNRRDIYAQAPTVEELAHTLQIPDVSLRQTVTETNQAVAKGTDTAGPGLTEPPFYALGPAKSWIVITEGGLAVTTRLEVLDASGNTIPGLYAAGSTGQGGVLLEGHGMHLCWAFTSGRIAGRSAAAG